MAEFTGVVKRVEGRKAILEIDKGHTLILPLKYLPKSIKESDTVVLEAISVTQQEARRQNIAKALLGEILGTAEVDAQDKKGQ